MPGTDYSWKNLTILYYIPIFPGIGSDPDIEKPPDPSCLLDMTLLPSSVPTKLTMLAVTLVNCDSGVKPTCPYSGGLSPRDNDLFPDTTHRLKYYYLTVSSSDHYYQPPAPSPGPSLQPLPTYNWRDGEAMPDHLLPVLYYQAMQFPGSHLTDTIGRIPRYCA